MHAAGQAWQSYFSFAYAQHGIRSWPIVVHNTTLKPLPAKAARRPPGLNAGSRVGGRGDLEARVVVPLLVFNVALLAGAGLAIGTAWGGLLAHFAAGVFLLILARIKSVTLPPRVESQVQNYTANPFQPGRGDHPPQSRNGVRCRWCAHTPRTNRAIRETFAEAGYPVAEAHTVERRV